MLAADYPQIKAFVRFQSNAGGGNGVALHHGNDTFYWKNSYFVDDNIFEVFSHKILYGDPKTALKDGAALAVSATFARKYFGNANPIGEIVSTGLGHPAAKIALVFEDLPPNTHLKYDMLFSSNLPFLRDPGELDAAPAGALGRQQLHLSAHGAGIRSANLAAHQ